MSAFAIPNRTSNEPMTPSFSHSRDSESCKFPTVELTRHGYYQEGCQDRLRVANGALTLALPRGWMLKAPIGKQIATQTRNDVVISNRWRKVEVAPNTFMDHVVLPLTAKTVSVGELNAKHGIAYRWLEPHSSGAPGESAMIKTAAGHVLQGTFEVWPLSILALMPERQDQDPIIVADLHHCSTQSCDCSFLKLHSFLQSLKPSSGLPAQEGGASSSEDTADAALAAAEDTIPAPPEPHPEAKKRLL